MSYFKAALTEIDNINVAIIWLDSKYLNNQEEIQKQTKFFKELIGAENVVIMILDENEKPVYYGKKEIVYMLKLNVWKKFPWKSYELGKTTS